MVPDTPGANKASSAAAGGCEIKDVATMKKEYDLGLVKVTKNTDSKQFEVYSGEDTHEIRGLGGDHQRHRAFTKELGRGSFGVVLLSCHKQSGKFVAMKKIHYHVPAALEYFMREVNNLLRIGRGHPCIVDMLDVFQDKRANLLYIAMEYYPSGDLEKYRLSQPGACLNEEDMTVVACSLFRGLGHIHTNFMIHRDIKPKNVLIRTNSDGRVCRAVIADLGSGKILESDQSNTKRLGTVPFMAPEVDKGRYGTPADIFSAGVLLLVCGVGQVMDAEEFERDKTFLIKAFGEKFLDENASLVEKMVDKSAALRPTAGQVLGHPWLSSFTGSTTDDLDLEQLHANMALLKEQLAQERGEKSQLELKLAQERGEKSQLEKQLAEEKEGLSQIEQQLHEARRESDQQKTELEGVIENLRKRLAGLDLSGDEGANNEKDVAIDTNGDETKVPGQGNAEDGLDGPPSHPHGHNLCSRSKKGKNDEGTKDDEGNGDSGDEDYDEDDEDDVSKQEKARKANGGAKAKIKTIPSEEEPAVSEDTPTPLPSNREDSSDVEDTNATEGQQDSGFASPSTSSASASASVQAPVYSDAAISSLIEDRGYGEPLAEKVRGMYRVVNAGKTDCHKFLQSYSPTDLESDAWEEFRKQCVSSDSSNGIVYAILTGPFLVAAIERIRRAIFTDRDFSKSTEIESDTIGLFMGHYHFLKCRLAITTKKVEDVKNAIAKLPIRPGMSRKDIFEICSKEGEEDENLSESTPKCKAIPSSSTQLRMDAINKACLTELGRAPTSTGTSEENPGPTLDEANTLLALKSSKFLLGHLTAIGVVLTGMSHIPFRQLSAAIRTKVVGLASAQGIQITDTAMISDAFEKVIMPALDNDAYEKRAIDLLLDTMVELEAMPDEFVRAASKAVHGNDGDDSYGGYEDGKDDNGDDNGDDDGLPNLKKDYLVITAGVLLSKCMSRKLKRTVGFEEDVLEIILRGSNSYLDKHLRPIIWPSIGKAQKPLPSFIFAGDASDNDIGSIVKHLKELVTRARTSNFELLSQGIRKSEWKSIEYWKKRSMLQATTKNASLVARALIVGNEEGRGGEGDDGNTDDGN